MKKQSHKHSLPELLGLFKDAGIELGRNAPLRMAGATAFFTTFALPPILIILIQVLGLVYNPEKISHELFEQLSEEIGTYSTKQIISTLTAFRSMAQNRLITVVGFVFLLFVATTLFKVIKGSLNQLWRIKEVKKQSPLKVLVSRMQSIGIILLAGVLLVLGIAVEGAQAFLGKYMSQLAPGLAMYLNSAINYIFSIIIVTVWFAIMFRYLPDARPEWKVVMTGALVTGMLFLVGKFILRWMLTYSNIGNLYGASGSIVLLLLFVFYSSLLLYYGAAFTKVWGIFSGSPIRPLPGAIHYRLTETDMEE